MSKTVLMIAFHFPPAAVGSGHLRTIGLARHLSGHGWKPLVLTANAAAYPRTVPIAPDLIPVGCEVHRAFALDAGRHLALAGKYPAFIARPDRWVSWWPAAVLQGLRLIRQHKVRAIWSTYPVMTAHCIARTLARTTGLPWIADFRDPVSDSVEAGNSHSAVSQQRWERRVLADAARIVFTTRGALRDCSERFPKVASAGRLRVIANGHDDERFSDLPLYVPYVPGRPFTLLHSGLLYSEGRDPSVFFTAIARLKDRGAVMPATFRVVLRASGSEPRYMEALRRLGIEGIVELAPPIPNHDALVEQASADALLLIQSESFDRQIPAKVYEYLRVGRPIFALAGEHGDTAALLRQSGGAELVRNDAEAIERGLVGFINAVCEGRAPRANTDVVARNSRRVGAALLASMLDEVVVRL